MTVSEAEAYSRLYGDAYYIFDEARFVANYHALISAFRHHYQNTCIAYSYKTNYVPAICQLPNVTLAGLHCHFPHRELQSFIGRTSRLVDIARQVFTGPPAYLSIGGGFFGHMPDSMKRKYSDGVPGFEDYGRAVGQIVASAYGNGQAAPILFIEPGTALVADTFSFV